MMSSDTGSQNQDVPAHEDKKDRRDANEENRREDSSILKVANNIWNILHNIVK
jgi:hypothetical protein